MVLTFQRRPVSDISRGAVAALCFQGPGTLVTSPSPASPSFLPVGPLLHPIVGVERCRWGPALIGADAQERAYGEQRWRRGFCVHCRRPGTLVALAPPAPHNMAWYPATMRAVGAVAASLCAGRHPWLLVPFLAAARLSGAAAAPVWGRPGPASSTAGVAGCTLYQWEQTHGWSAPLRTQCSRT